MSRGSTEAVKSDMNNNHNKPSQHLKISKELSRAFTLFHPEVPRDTGRAGSMVPVFLTEDMEAQTWQPAYPPDLTRPGSLVWGSFYVGGKKEREREKLPGGVYTARGWARPLQNVCVESRAS